MIGRRLSLFAAIVEHGSVARAAAALRLTQPALTRQLQQLERQVGTALASRGNRGVRLTPAGEALRAAAMSYLAKATEAVQHSEQAHVGLRGNVRVALGRIAVESDVVAAALARLREVYPEIRIDLLEIAATEQVDALRNANADIAIGVAAFSADRKLGQAILYREDVDGAILGASHPLAGKTSVDLTELCQEPFLGLRPFPGAVAATLEEIARAGVTRIQQHDSLDGIFALVAGGRGWTVAPRCMRSHPPPGTRVIPIRDFRVAAPVFVGWRRDGRTCATGNVLRTLLATTGAEIPGELRPETQPPARVPRTPLFEARHLRALAVAIDEGSLSSAASRLRLTQSGLSRRIQALEREVGMPLLQRIRQGVTATAAGKVLRCNVEHLLRLADEAVVAARRCAGIAETRCRIASVPMEMAAPVLLPVLQRLNDEAPHIAIDFIEMKSEQQVTAINEGRADVGLATAIGASFEFPVASVVLTHDPINCALLPASHPLARRAWLTAADLAAVPFIFTSPQQAPRWYATIMSSLAALGFSSVIHEQNSGLRAVWRATLACDGWTWGRRSQLAGPPAGMVGIPILGLSIDCGIALIWRRGETDPVIHRVLDAFRSTQPAIQTPSGTGIPSGAQTKSA